MKRLTLNYGGRFDHFNSEVPAQYFGADHLAAVRPRFRGDRERAELERLGDPPRRLLRPVRDRQDRAEGQHQQVHGLRGGRLRGDVQPDGPVGGNPPMDRSRQQPDDLRRQREHPVQRSRGRQRELRPGRGHTDARPGSEARLQLGDLGVGAARADAEGVDYRRLLLPEIRQPAHQRQPQPEPDRLDAVHNRRTDKRPFPDRRRRDDHDVHPQSDRKQDERLSHHVLDCQYQHLQRRRIQRERAVRQGVLLRRHHDRAARNARVRRQHQHRELLRATTPTAFASATTSLRSARRSRARQPTRCRGISR